jgi:hypothetical protein
MSTVSITHAISNVEKKKDESPAEKIIRYAIENDTELFHSPDGQPFLRTRVDGHWETLAMGKKSGFRDWLGRLYYLRENKPVPETAINEANSVLVARAKHDGHEYPVFVRIGGDDGCIYLDLANEAWEAVKITSDGWEVVNDPPIRFRRPNGMQPLPRPIRGGNINQLRDFVNVGNEDQWVLLIAWLISCFRPSGPYPILHLDGSQGCAKSTLTKLLRYLIDPNTAPTRSEPKDARDLMISAKNGWCLAFDNLSRMPEWLSDALCRVATGGGYATRRLNTDDDEALFEATRPIVINGIAVNITRSDLLDRTLVLTLPTIDSRNRMSEADYWERLEGVRPELLGALLTAVSGALQRLHDVHLADLPRMADFMIWITAAEQALGLAPGTMVAAYNRNRMESNEVALENCPLVPAIERLVENHLWKGSATELLNALPGEAFDLGETSTEGWPTKAAGLSHMLRRVEPNLSAIGIGVEFGKSNGSRSKRLITIKKHRMD